jgi:uncharacterized protein
MVRAWPPVAGGEKCVVGMVHLLPLPGSPLGGTDIKAVVDQAVEDAHALERGGADAVLVQNRGDRAFAADHAPLDVVAAMGAVAREVVRATSLPVGVHVLRNDTIASLAVAKVSGGSFVRAAVLTGESYSAQGRLAGDPHATLRYRRAIGAEDVMIFADVSSMHNRTPASEAPEAAGEAIFFGAADAVVVSHPSTGEAVSLAGRVREAVDVPVLIGGHADHENVSELLGRADGVIVGGAFERHARRAGIEERLVREFVQRVHRG